MANDPTGKGSPCRLRLDEDGFLWITGRAKDLVIRGGHNIDPVISSHLAIMRRTFADIATTIAHQSGRPVTFIVALLIIVLWAVTGPLFHFSDTWQLIINTSTTIITFLMVFVIQNTQNRDGAAIQAKLDELIRVSSARNSLIGIESLTREEIEEIRARCADKAGRAVNGSVKEANNKAKAAARKALS